MAALRRVMASLLRRDGTVSASIGFEPGASGSCDELVQRINMILSCVSVLDQGVWTDLIESLAKQPRTLQLAQTSVLSSYLARLSLTTPAPGGDVTAGGDVSRQHLNGMSRPHQAVLDAPNMRGVRRPWNRCGGC